MYIMNSIEPYSIVEKIFENRTVVVLRAVDSNKKSYILKSLKPENLTGEKIQQYRNSFTIARRLNNRGIVRPISIGYHNDLFTIVFEDFGGISLKQYLSLNTCNITQFLTIAQTLCHIIGDVHAHNVIHKDIKPDNIILRPPGADNEDWQIKVTDFHIASEISQELSVAPHGVLQGSLQYISPEQTGRMNRSVDFRTDLYSLGITLYEMITGKLPFTAATPLDLVNAHITHEPIAPVEINHLIPVSISSIILKLLSKNPDERYKSAYGVENDIKECIYQLDTSGLIMDFTPGERDVADKFILPEKLYGRSREITILMDNYGAALKGQGKFLLISGYSGIGKTTLINEIRKLTSPDNPYFISGKYEQNTREVPLSGLIQAFTQLVSQVLSESEESIRQWREKLFNTLYPNIKLILDILPQLELITGPQPVVSDLGTKEAQNRFNRYVTLFITLFAAPGRPLVIFLDDLQWADDASFQLLKTILAEGYNNILIVGSYRSNEVTEHHAMAHMMRELEQSGLAYTALTLEPLSTDDIALLLHDTLSVEQERVTGLAAIVQEKTRGNPFFVREFIRNLYYENYIRYTSEWKWETENIQQANITDNVSDFLTRKLNKIPGEMLQLLKTASCIGDTFSIGLLQAVTNSDETELFTTLKDAIQKGLIIKSGENFRFSHDKIQETSYSFLDDDEKEQIHFNTGTALLKLYKDNPEEAVFPIVKHLNIGKKHIPPGDSAIDVARLNAAAGKKSKESAALEAAYRYYLHAAELAGEDIWTNNYHLALEIFTSAVEVSFFTGREEEGSRYFMKILENAATPLDTIPAFEIKMSYLSSLLQFKESLKTGLEALHHIGMTIPRKASLFRSLLSTIQPFIHIWKHNIEDFEHLPVLSDAQKLAAARILMGCIEPSYLGVPNHLPLIISRLFMVSVRNGNSPYASYAYIMFAGIILQITGNIDMIMRLSAIALKVLARSDGHQIASKVFFIYGVGVSHWARHIREDLPFLLKSYEHAAETGDITYASYAIHHYLINTFFSGEPLEEVLEKYNKYYPVMKKLNLLNTLQSFEQMYQLVINLVDLKKNNDSTSIAGEIFDEKRIIPEWKNSESLTILGHYAVSKMMLCNFSGNYRHTIDAAREGKKYLDSMMGLFFIPEYWFHYALGATLLSLHTGTKEKVSLLRIANKSAKKIMKWARSSPENYQHKYFILQAVRQGVAGKISESLELFEKAIQSAKTNRFTQYEALANELASFFSYESGLYSISEMYSLRACNAYSRWGAKSKLTQLKEQHQKMFGKSIQSPDSQIGANNQTASLSDSSGIYSTIIDLSSILKSAHTIAKEIHLEKLVESLIRIALENAAGQKGVLLLKKGSKLFIDAEIFSDNSKVTVLNSIPIEDYTDSKGRTPGLPVSIINYISRTHQDIIIDNAAADFRFNNDPYIVKNNIRSILCTPIIYQNNLTGILYIENNIVSGAFAPERLTVMKMLSSQAAISIEISSIYAGLEALVKERTEIIEAQKQELEHQINLAGKIQTALLPREIPEFDEMTIAFRYKPMMGIGGDFLDIKYSEQDKSIGFFICDVSGHGVAAALVASMVKMSLSGWENTLAQPRETLYGLYELLSEKIDNYFISATVCHIDIETGKLTSAKAGHTPTIIVRKNGKVEILNPKGRVINRFMKPNYIETETMLFPGDKIILYTDGITEAFDSERRIFGEESFLELIHAHSSLPPGSLCDSILDALSKFTGTTASSNDDITILTIEYRGK